MEALTVIDIFAMVGLIINDLFAIFGFIGSLILLLGSFGKASWKKYGPVAEWSVLGLGFGWLFQLSMAFTGTTPEQIGITRMPTLMVYALLSTSLLMVIGRIVIRRLLRSGK